MEAPPEPAASDSMAFVDRVWQSHLVLVQKSELQGRFQLSAAAIPKSTVIFQALPYAASLFESFKKRICGRCYKFNPTGAFQLKCISCSDIWYCNKDCESADSKMHQMCCQLYQRLGKHDKDLQPLIRMIINILIRRHRETTGELKNELIDEPTFLDVEGLISHEEEWSEDEKTIWKKMSLWIVDLMSGTPYWNEWISVKNLMRLISQIECNCFGIHAAGKETIYGRVLYPRASFFNHSCAPNCDTFQQVATQTLHMCFVANKDIAKDEEVTISYINENRPRSARRENLMNDYHFQCICVRCETEKALSHVKVTYHKSKNSHALKGAKRKEEKQKKKALEKAKAISPPATPVGEGTSNTSESQFVVLVENLGFKESSPSNASVGSALDLDQIGGALEKQQF